CARFSIATGRLDYW
nr:immunoglobulin heavy chain junction region [Macaca mulatta]